MPVPVAWADGGETEMVDFRSSADEGSKPQAWLPQYDSHSRASPANRVTAGRSLGHFPQTALLPPAPNSTAPAIIAVLHPSTSYSYITPASVPAAVSAPSHALPTAVLSASSSSSFPPSSFSLSGSSHSLSPSSSSVRSVSFRLSPSRRSRRRPSTNLTGTTSLGLSSASRDGHTRTASYSPTPADPHSAVTAALTAASTSQTAAAAASSVAAETLEGYTVIDIRSLPSSVSASLTSSPAHSPLSSPAPSHRFKPLRVDTAQLMQAAAEEDVSPRTALFLAMKQKAKHDKKKAKKAKERGDRERERDKEKPSHVAGPAAGSHSIAASGGQQQQQAAAGKRHTLQPYSSSSVSSSLHSLSLSPELSSLSASLSLSPRSSLSRGSVDDDRRGERRLKKDERQRLGYKLCKVSGCMEPRGRDADGHHYKYCKAHLGIHTLNNPNTRNKTQRDGGR